MSKRSMRVLVAAMVATLASVTPAVAQQMETATPPGDRWTIRVAPYLWAASMDGHSAVGGVKSDVDEPYNKVNGEANSGNHHLLNEVLKGAFAYQGYVMSDWGAVQSWDFALKGLDQESGAQLDLKNWKAEMFTAPLRNAYAEGNLPKERLSDMVRRILRSIYAVGVDQWGPAPGVDMAQHNEIALEVARQGIVVPKNDGILPLATDQPLKIAGSAAMRSSASPWASARAPCSRWAAMRRSSRSAGRGPWALRATCICYPRRRSRS